MDDTLRSQLAFIEAIGGLKSVLRRNYLASGARVENSAEHSWHAAVMAYICAEHSDEPVDTPKVVLMLLIHDIVEVLAGDTYVYDADARRGQEEKEQAAAEQLFGMLPERQAQELLALWNEFEARETPEARFAKAIDNFLPLLQNMACAGKSWKENEIARERVVEHNTSIREGSRVLWDAARRMIDEAYDHGYLK